MLNQTQIEMLAKAKLVHGHIMPVVNKKKKSQLCHNWAPCFDEWGLWFNTPDKSTHFILYDGLYGVVKNKIKPVC